MPLLLVLLLLAAILPLVVGVKMIADPVSASRMERFARRHGLELSPVNHEIVGHYLASTRRWRVFGLLCAYVVTAVPMLTQQRIGVEFVPLLAGWLAGALIGELRFRALASSQGWRPPVGEVVPRWLTRVPWVLAAASAAATMLATVAAPGTASIVAWGTGALVCAGVMAAGNWYIAGRVSPRGESAAEAGEDDAGAASRATRADSIAFLTAAGTALVVLCAAQQIRAMGSGLFGESAVAVEGIGWLWVLGALSAGWILRTAGWPAPQPAPVTARPLVQLGTVTTIVVVSSLTWLGYGWRVDSPPYGPEAIGATAMIRFTDTHRFPDDARALGITGINAMPDIPGGQMFVGRVDFAVPSNAPGSGTYHLVVLDKRSNSVAPMLYNENGGGWNGFLHEVPKRYPWLSAMEPVAVGGGWSDPGSEVSSPSNASSPIVFAGMFRDKAIASAADLTVVIIFSGSRQQIYWAAPIAQSA